MQDHELDAWLGDTPATDEHRAALLRAAATIAHRYPDEDMRIASEQAFAGAAQIILGDSSLADLGDEYARARRAERDAMAALTGAIIAAAPEMSESAISRDSGLTRMTVRKALGK